MRIAFIGLGHMGSAMARNLLAAGHQLLVYNRTRQKAEPLIAAGAQFAGSPADAARDCEAAVTMLADDAAVEATVFGEKGLADGLKPGAVHIGCSTIGTAFAKKLAAAHSNRGQEYVSVPVFGRPEAAAERKLLVVAAGEAAVVERCRPVFDAIGRQYFVAGTEPWQANAVKLCGNFMIASMLESFGEAFATLRKSGVAPHLFLDVINSLFASPVYANYGSMIANERFQPTGFALRLGLKDIRLAIETAREVTSPMPLASLIHDHGLEGIALGQGDWDWSSLGHVPARNAGL